MRGRPAPSLGLSALLLAVAGLVLAGCPTTVNDLEKWRNRPHSEERFVEWMLQPEATPEVRAKAIEMLVEQWNYEGAANLPRVAELPPEARDRAILDALPHITELYQGREFGLGGDNVGQLRPVQVRDAAIILANTTDNPEVREALFDAVVVPWLRDHYRPCITSTGRHPNARILSLVGPSRSLPVVVRYVREGSTDDVACQSSFLPEVTWLEEQNEALATAYVERWNTRPPQTVEQQRRFAAAMLDVPESRVLKNWIFEQILETEAALLPDVVDAFLTYVQPLTDETDDERYAAMVQRFDGFLRWIGVQNLIRLRGAEGIHQALAAMPDAGVWGRWGGSVLHNGFRRAAEWVCARPELAELGEAARAVFEEHLESDNLIARAIAIQCLSELGDADTLALLREQAEIGAVIPSWGGAGGLDDPPPERDEDDEEDAEEATTSLGELAAQVIERIEARLAGSDDGEGG